MDSTSRREFLRCCACVGALGALEWLGVGCGAGGGGGGPTAPSGATFDVNLANESALAADNSVVVVSGTPRGDIFLTHTTGETYFALSRICTHQGCTVGLPDMGVPGLLHCPCHGSRYTLTGAVSNGPAPNPLESWQVTRNGNTLTIHF